MPKKENEAEKIMGPQSAALTVQRKVNEIKDLSAQLSLYAKTLTLLGKTVGRSGSERKLNIHSHGVKGESAIFELNLTPRDNFSAGDKLAIMDAITEQSIEYLRHEIAAIYDEIQKLGKEL